MSLVAAIQMCSSCNVTENLEHTGKLISAAASNGAKLVVLPEMFSIMGTQAEDKVKLQERYGEGKIQDFLAKSAKQYKLWIVGGTIPITSEDPNRVHAACILYNDQGESVARYDKINLFNATLENNETYKESNTTMPGNQIVVADTPFGKLGLCVCHDLRFPNLFDELRKKGAEIIAVPSAFAMKTGMVHWELLTRCRAIDTFCYLIGAGQGGVHTNGRETFGNSIIVDPWGRVLSQVTDDNPIIYANIDLDELHRIRQKMPHR
jgi:predicted amidohydrolase